MNPPRKSREFPPKQFSDKFETIRGTALHLLVRLELIIELRNWPAVTALEKNLPVIRVGAVRVQPDGENLLTVWVPVVGSSATVAVNSCTERGVPVDSGTSTNLLRTRTG